MSETLHLDQAREFARAVLKHPHDKQNELINVFLNEVVKAREAEVEASQKQTAFLLNSLTLLKSKISL